MLDRQIIIDEVSIDIDYRVNPVYTGADRFKEIRSYPYDLAPLDIMLPYKNGDEVLRGMSTFCEECV